MILDKKVNTSQLIRLTVHNVRLTLHTLKSTIISNVITMSAIVYLTRAHIESFGVLLIMALYIMQESTWFKAAFGLSQTLIHYSVSGLKTLHIVLIHNVTTLIICIFDFIWLMLVIIAISLRWIENITLIFYFSASVITMVLLRNYVSTWGYMIKLRSDTAINSRLIRHFIHISIISLSSLPFLIAHTLSTDIVVIVVCVIQFLTSAILWWAATIRHVPKLLQQNLIRLVDSSQ